MRCPVIQSAAKMKIFRRFMRTNAPAALRQVWTEVRLQLRLAAVQSFVAPSPGVVADDLFTAPWREIDGSLPKAGRAAVSRFLDGFVALYGGTCSHPPCAKDIRSGVPVKVSRYDTSGEDCACCRALFEAEEGNLVNDVLIVPRLAAGNTAAGQALVFCSAAFLGPDEARFLHTAAGLYFAQQTIWESGQREEPVAALRPREIECIRWAVTGKTLAEIAEVMGLSYRTVRFHLDTARARYGFSTNQQLFVQAAKDYGLDPEGDNDTPRRVRPAGAKTIGRIQPSWAERRDPRDRRATDRRQVNLAGLPFPDRRVADRRTGRERRSIAQEEARTSGEQLLTPEEIRALLH